MRLFLNTTFAPALVAFADNFWQGRPKAAPEFFLRLPPDGTHELDLAKSLEDRIVAQRDKVLKDFVLPFPYVRQTQYRWRVTDGEGRVVEDCHVGGFFDVGSLVTNKTGLVVAETWIRSPEDRTVGAWIEFDRTASTGGRCNCRRPELGQWSILGSSIEVNGEKISPPEWCHPGVYSDWKSLPKDGKVWLFNGVPYSDAVSETPIGDEWNFTRPPTQIHLRKGWNHVKLTMPKNVEDVEPFWRAVFLLLEGTSERPLDVDGLEFFSDMP